MPVNIAPITDPQSPLPSYVILTPIDGTPANSHILLLAQWGAVLQGSLQITVNIVQRNPDQSFSVISSDAPLHTTGSTTLLKDFTMAPSPDPNQFWGFSLSNANGTPLQCNVAPMNPDGSQSIAVQLQTDLDASGSITLMQSPIDWQVAADNVTVTVSNEAHTTHGLHMVVRPGEAPGISYNIGAGDVPAPSMVDTNISLPGTATVVLKAQSALWVTMECTGYRPDGNFDPNRAFVLMLEYHMGIGQNSYTPIIIIQCSM